MNRRSVLFLASALSLHLLAAAPARAETSIRFIVDWSFQGQHAMFTIPVDDGTYAKMGLNVNVDRGAGSGDTVAKVASGAYDMGLADIYSMVRFNNENPGHKLIAVMIVDDKSALAVEVKASSPIKTPQDLNGKTLAAPVGDATRQLFPLFAAVNHIDESSIKWINVSPELREPLLVRGEADAITGHLTTVMLNFANIGVKTSDIRTMPYIDFGVNLLGHAVIVKPEFAERIRSNPQLHPRLGSRFQCDDQGSGCRGCVHQKARSADQSGTREEPDQDVARLPDDYRQCFEEWRQQCGGRAPGQLVEGCCGAVRHQDHTGVVGGLHRPLPAAAQRNEDRAMIRSPRIVCHRVKSVR